MLYSAPAAISSSIDRINSGTCIRRLALEPSRLVRLEISSPLGDVDLHLFRGARGPRLARSERPLRIKPVLSDSTSPWRTALSGCIQSDPSQDGVPSESTLANDS